MSKTYTHKSRFMTAVNHQEPDRVPLCMDAEAEIWPKLAKALNVQTKEECYKALEIDEWMLDPHVTDPRRKTISEDESVSQWGYHVCRTKTEYGFYHDICKPPIKGEELTLEEIDNHNWPDHTMIDFDHYDNKMKEMGERAFISHITHGPYFNCTFIRGMENFLMDIAMSPDLAKRMMDRAEEYIQGAIDNLLVNARPLPDVYYIADDFCSSSGPLFSPTVWREWVKPYLTRIGNKVHSKGVKFMIHVCGSVRPYLPDLIEAGVDILEPVQTTAVGMSLESLKKDFGKDITFYGSIDTHHVLPKGTKQEVEDAVKHTIDIMAPGGGFILGPAHTYIQPDTPIENIITMYKTALAYGKY